jgi:hypothetical protein
MRYLWPTIGSAALALGMLSDVTAGVALAEHELPVFWAFVALGLLCAIGALWAMVNAVYAGWR